MSEGYASDRMVDSSYNEVAAQFLKRARESLAFKQPDFAHALRDKLGVNVSQSALSGWENAARGVPGPVIAVVLEMLGQPLAAFALGEPAPPTRLATIEEEVVELADAVASALDAIIPPPADEGSADHVERIRRLAEEVRARLKPEP